MLTTRDNNPANAAEKGTGARKRIPMALPVMRLEVPEIKNYHIHWFANDPMRIQRALSGGYEFVQEDEVELNRLGIANGVGVSGSSGLGSRIELEGMILMKLSSEYWDEDTAAYEADQEKRISALRSPDGLSSKEGDNSHRYSNGDQSHAFTLQRRAPKGRTPIV